MRRAPLPRLLAAPPCVAPMQRRTRGGCGYVRFERGGAGESVRNCGGGACVWKDMATATIPAVVTGRGAGSRSQAVPRLWLETEPRSETLPAGKRVLARDKRLETQTSPAKEILWNGLVEEAHMPPEEPKPRRQTPAAGEARDDRGGGADRAAIVAEQRSLAALAGRCLEGDADAWEQLARSQHRRIYAICYRFTGSQSDAEDLTQEAFLKMYRNLGSFDAERGSFTTWLTTLTRNLLVDHYRRSRMERASDSLDESQDGEEDGPRKVDRLADGGRSQEQHLAGMELRAQIQQALGCLSAELREAVILRDLQEMDYKEIAEVLGVPQGTVKSRISRGRCELARLLKRMEGQVM